MIKRILRVSLATLALVFATSGALNMNPVVAQDEEIIVDDGGDGEFAGLCQYCGCNGGKIQCCSEGKIICYQRT